MGDAIISLLDCSSDITKSLKKNRRAMQNNSFVEGLTGSQSKLRDQKDIKTFMQAKKVFKTNRNRNAELDFMNKHLPTHRSLSISEQFEPGYRITILPSTTGAINSSSI